MYSGYKTFIRFIICQYFIPLFGSSFEIALSFTKSFHFDKVQFFCFFNFVSCIIAILLIITSRV